MEINGTLLINDVSYYLLPTTEKIKKNGSKKTGLMLGVQLLKGNTLYGAIGFTPLANVPDRVFLYNKASGKEQYYIAAYFALISNLIY